MDINKFQSKFLLSIFALVILTIIVYKYFDEYSSKITEYVDPNHPKPPKSKFDPMDWGFEWENPIRADDGSLQEDDPMFPIDTNGIEGFQNQEKPKLTPLQEMRERVHKFRTDQSKWLDDTITTFLPNDTFTSFKFASVYEDENIKPNTEDEPTVEGFVELMDFFQFLEFLFELILAMICFVISLPFHIFYFIVALYYFIEAFFIFIINFLVNIFKTFRDFNQMMHDISKCGMTWSKNLKFCGLWYLIEIVGYIAMLLFVWLPVTIVRILTFGKIDLNNFFISIIGVKGSGYRDTNGRLIQRDGILAIISKKFKKIIGFDPMHFPPNVMEKCYSCNIISDFFTVIYDLTVGFLNTLQRPMESVGKGFPWIWKALYLDAFVGKGSFCSSAFDFNGVSF